jgi:hypothetical protein
VVNAGCLGDEQMFFVPRKPNLGVHVQISVTSQRHHDAHVMALGGPLDSGPVVERLGTSGFVWTWTVIPTVEDFYQWTFFADGLHPCITSGFNAFAPLGATETPTVTPVPTDTPGTATATPSVTPVPIPTITTPAGTTFSCNSVGTIQGTNFGSPPSSFSTVANLFSNGTTTQLSQVGTGSNTQLRVNVPASGPANGTGQIQVSNSGGDSNLVTVNITGCPTDAVVTGSATATPTPSPSETPTPTSTSTPTNTPVPAPTITTTAGTTFTCGTVATIQGTNFGSPPSALNTNAFLSSGGKTFTLSQVGTGSNTQIRVNMPASGSGATNGSGQIFVSNTGGDSNLVTVTVAGC